MMTLLSRIGHHLLNSHGGMAPFGAFWARHDAAVHKRRPAEANTMQKKQLGRNLTERVALGNKPASHCIC